MSITRFILGSMVVLAAVVGGTLLTLCWQNQRVAGFADRQLLDTAVSVQAVLQSQRQHGQEWETSTIARDAGFVSYIGQVLAAGAAPGATGIDSASLRDQLAERRGESFLTALLLLDTTGHTLVASGSVDLEQRDYSATPLLKDVLAKQGQATAIWADKQKLTLVTVVPVMRGTVLQALLMSQEPINKSFVDALGKTSHADVAVVVRDADTLRLAASTLSAHDAMQLQGQLASAPALALDSLASPANSAALVPFNLGDHVANGRAAALFNSPKTAMVIALVPGDYSAALTDSFGLPLAVAGFAVILLLLLFAVLVWLKLLRPIAKLSKLAERGAFGDHELLPKYPANPHFARISESINHLIKEMLGRRRKTDWK